MGWLAVIGVACIVALAACNTTPLFGPPTEATCPTDAALTYANFGQAFMESYCVRCHSSKLMAADRMGAPLLHDFDTLPGITIFISHIDETSAAGPAATNTSMPNGDPEPSAAERLLLGQWLACNAPP